MMLESLLPMDAGGLGLFAQADTPFWLPPPDSTTAGAVDGLMYFLLYISAFFFVLIVALMVVFAIIYRRRSGVKPRPAPKSSLVLELTWTIIPLGIVVVIFYWGFVGYMEMRLPPREAYEIEVVARQWAWAFKYSNNVVDGEVLHVPVDRPVRLLMRSEDVIHSLWIPDFRVKMDLVPGRYTKTWFKATQSGKHDLYCAEYCGTQHADMMATVWVHPPGEFEQWLDNAARFAEDMTPAQRGEMLYRRACRGCHSIDGTARTGPTFQGVYGETHRFTDGSEAVVDENYIRESILEPSAKIREGYRDQMNSFKGQLTDEEIDQIITFIKTLK